MLIQDKQQEAAVDSALLGSQTNHGLTSHNGNFSTLCIHRILIIPAGLPDQRSAWFAGCLSVCMVWIAVLLCPSSFGRRVAVVVQWKSWLRLLPSLCQGKMGASLSWKLLIWLNLFSRLLSVAVQSLLALTAAKELLRMKPKGAACCVFVWACSDEALGWAACLGFSWALGHGLWGGRLPWLGLCLCTRGGGSSSFVGCCLVLT